MKNKSIITLLILSSFLWISTDMVFAEPIIPVASVGVTEPPPASGGVSDKPVTIVKLDNPIQADNIQSLLFNIVDLAIFLGSIVAVLMFVYVGFKFIMAQGNQNEIKEAKAWFMGVIIGTAILISSKVIVSVLQNTLVGAGVVDKNVFILKK